MEAPELSALMRGRVLVSCVPRSRPPVLNQHALDDHLSVDGARDLDPPVLETLHRLGSLPARVLANVGRLGGKVGQSARIEVGLLERALVQKALARRVEVAVQDREERERGGRDDLRVRALDLACGGTGGRASAIAPGGCLRAGASSRGVSEGILATPTSAGRR